MNTRHLTSEERYELVLECRRSGMTDYQWLEEHGIRKSTFYKWIHDFRENGYPDDTQIAVDSSLKVYDQETAGTCRGVFEQSG